MKELVYKQAKVDRTSEYTWTKQHEKIQNKMNNKQLIFYGRYI